MILLKPTVVLSNFELVLSDDHHNPDGFGFRFLVL